MKEVEDENALKHMFDVDLRRVTDLAAQVQTSFESSFLLEGP